MKRPKGTEISGSDPVDGATNGLAILARMIARKHLQCQRERLAANEESLTPPPESENEDLS